LWIDWVYFATPAAASFADTRKVVAEARMSAQHLFGVFAYPEELFCQTLHHAGYRPDPILKRYVGISIEKPEDLEHIKCSVTKPGGNNTLRRWEEVFPNGLTD